MHYWGGSIGDPRLDNTRFIGWREYKNEIGEVERTGKEANVVDGEMISLVLQNNGIRTQGRVDLDKDNSLRQIATRGWMRNNPEDAKTAEHEIAHSTYMVEFNDGSTKEQLLSLRYYGGHILNNDGKADKIWLALAHMRAGGATILTAVCNIAANESYNKECSSVADSDFKLHYVDADGKEHDDIGTTSSSNIDLITFKQTIADFVTNTAEKWAHGTYTKENLDPRSAFFGGTGELVKRREALFTAGLPTAEQLAQDEDE